MIIRPVASLAELRAAWELVAAILLQDETHTRNFAFYAEQFRRYRELLLVACGVCVGSAAADESSMARTPQPAADAFAGGLTGALLAHAAAGYVHVGKLAVAEPHRGRGVGSALLRKAERGAAAIGRPWLTLGADPAAVPFYLRHGYQPGILLQQAGEDGMCLLVGAARTHLPGRSAAWSASENGVCALLVASKAMDASLLQRLKEALPDGSVSRVFTKSL